MTTTTDRLPELQADLVACNKRAQELRQLQADGKTTLPNGIKIDDELKRLATAAHRIMNEIARLGGEY